MRSSKKRPLAPIPRVPPAIVVRMFLLASVAVIGCIWALVRYYTHPHAPMVAPVHQVAPVPSDEHPGEVPVEVVPVD